MSHFQCYAEGVSSVAKKLDAISSKRIKPDVEGSISTRISKVTV